MSFVFFLSRLWVSENCDAWITFEFNICWVHDALHIYIYISTYKYMFAGSWWIYVDTIWWKFPCPQRQINPGSSGRILAVKQGLPWQRWFVQATTAFRVGLHGFSHHHYIDFQLIRIMQLYNFYMCMYIDCIYMHMHVNIYTIIQLYLHINLHNFT